MNEESTYVEEFRVKVIMNWVGGARNRIKVKQERKIQKEFFEKKRFARKVRRSTPLSPGEKCNTAVSQDLYALKVIMAAHDAPKKKDRSVKKPVLVNLDGPKASRQIELPMSPCKPSKLHLGESPKVQAKNLSQQRDLASSHKVPTKPQTLKCEKEECKVNEKQYCDKGKIPQCGFTTSPKSKFRDSTEITKKSLSTNNCGLARTRDIKNSQDLTPRKKHPLRKGERSFIRKTSVQLQDRICFTETSSESSLRDNNSCMESVRGSFVVEKDGIQTDANSNMEYLFSKLEHEDFNVKSKYDDIKENENRKTIASPFKNRVRKQNIYDDDDCAGVAPIRVTPEKSPFVPYTMPGPLATFLVSKNTFNPKQDCYREEGYHRRTTYYRDLCSRSPNPKGTTGGESIKTFPLYTLTERISEKKAVSSMNSPAKIRSAEDFEERMNKLSDGTAVTSETSSLPEKQDSLDKGNRTEAKTHNSKWRQFVMHCEGTRDCWTKQTSPKSSSLVQFEETKSNATQPLYPADLYDPTDVIYKKYLSNTRCGNRRQLSSSVEIPENPASEALEEVMDLDKDIDSFSDSSCSSTWSSSASGGDSLSQDHPRSKQTKPTDNPKAETAESSGLKTQRTLGFKSLPRTQLTASFNSTSIMTKVSSANWFRIHSGIEDNKVGALPRDTQSSSVSISTGRKVAARSDDKESLAGTRNSKISVLSAVTDSKSPGARLLYCTETPSALVSPAFAGNTVTNANQSTSSTSPAPRNTFTNPCATCADTLLLSRRKVVSSKDLIKYQRTDHISNCQLTFQPLIGKDDINHTEIISQNESETEELFTIDENNSRSIVHISPANDIKSSIKPETVYAEQTVQTEHSLKAEAANPENAFNAKAVQTQDTFPINADKLTANQAIQTEHSVLSPIIPVKLVTDQSTQTNQIISSSTAAIQVGAEPSIPNELNVKSQIKITKSLDTMEAVLTENNRTTEKSTQTKRESSVSSSPTNMLQEQTQQLMEQISQLQNTCFHQSIIIQAMSGTEAPIHENR